MDLESDKVSMMGVRMAEWKRNRRALAGHAAEVARANQGASVCLPLTCGARAVSTVAAGSVTDRTAATADRATVTRREQEPQQELVFAEAVMFTVDGTC